MIKLLKTLQKTFGILAAIIAGYALISQNYGGMPYLMFAQGAMLLVMGLDEMKEERKKSGIFIIVSSLFLFSVGIATFLS